MWKQCSGSVAAAHERTKSVRPKERRRGPCRMQQAGHGLQHLLFISHLLAQPCNEIYSLLMGMRAWHAGRGAHSVGKEHQQQIVGHDLILYDE